MATLKKTVLDDIVLKKKHGQFFLQDYSVTDAMLENLCFSEKLIIEIGCGNGFITAEILKKNPKKLIVYEIDKEWAEYVQNKYKSNFLLIHNEDFLTVEHLGNNTEKCIVLSNLPYHITFPILYKLHRIKQTIETMVFMMQEEVAQKIAATQGKGYGYISLFFQYYYTIKLLKKIDKSAFFPQPKVFSRLISFTPKKDVSTIEQEEVFWKFIKSCFAFPRRTLKNNLQQTHYDITKIETNLLAKRAQQLCFDDFFAIWQILQV